MRIPRSLQYAPRGARYAPMSGRRNHVAIRLMTQTGGHRLIVRFVDGER